MRIGLSIILPSYNVGPYIEECLLSVVNQTMDDIEIICVDAGSSDGTRDIIERYANRDNRIIVIDSERKSYGYQMNRGLRIAKGEYIGFVETDDYVAKDMFETLHRKAVEKELDCVRAGYFSFYQQDGERYFNPSRVIGEEDPLNNVVISPEDYPELVATDGSIWRGIYHRNIFEGKGIFHETDGAAYQDIGFSLQIFSRIKRMMYIPGCLYYYRTGRSGASSLSAECLKFQYQEYSWLLDDVGLLKKNPGMERAFYLRMAMTFSSEYDKALEVSKYYEDSQFIEPYFSFFASEIGRAIREGIISEQYIPWEQWNKLRLIIENNDSYVEIKKKEYEIAQEKEQKLIAACLGKGVAIFGCGNHGKSVFDIISKSVDVVAFCDNNKKLWGTVRKGLIVYSPEEAAEKYRDCIWVIANRSHSDEIRRQLLEYGITDVYRWR